MNCREFEDAVFEVAREWGADVAALAHAEACPRCAARLGNEREVAAALRALATHSQSCEAPARVERALIASFRRGARARPAGRPGALWPIWGVAAAVVLLAAATALQPRAPGPAVSSSPAVSEPVEAADAGEFATEYFALQPGTDLTALDGAPVVRMQLPRTVLVAFGLPMNPERAEEPINADVVLGPDGIARAVRFVN
jgi:anti-sigma factor RsiW